MIHWLIEAALRNRFLVVAVCLLLGVWGYWALLTTPIDAIPDLSDNQGLHQRGGAEGVAHHVRDLALVVAKIARADTSTDPAPLSMTETVVALKPRAQWRPGMTREALVGELDLAATLPGVASIWTQPIINRITC